MHGAFTGLSLGATRAQLIRSSMEGVAMALNSALNIQSSRNPIEPSLAYPLTAPATTPLVICLLKIR
ncbi:hypothetical protein FACS189468_5320 [Spirochaetia bacterium]|nr:hypothetical protein FACS189468_5320 [Spirochaetia bacterium]